MEEKIVAGSVMCRLLVLLSACESAVEGLRFVRSELRYGYPPKDMPVIERASLQIICDAQKLLRVIGSYGVPIPVLERELDEERRERVQCGAQEGGRDDEN